MVYHKYVLIPWYPISYLMIAGYGFFFGRLQVPTRRCDLVVPADWGWGCSSCVQQQHWLCHEASCLLFANHNKRSFNDSILNKCRFL